MDICVRCQPVDIGCHLNLRIYTHTPVTPWWQTSIGCVTSGLFLFRRRLPPRQYTHYTLHTHTQKHYTTHYTGTPLHYTRAHTRTHYTTHTRIHAHTLHCTHAHTRTHMTQHTHYTTHYTAHIHNTTHTTLHTTQHTYTTHTHTAPHTHTTHTCIHAYALHNTRAHTRTRTTQHTHTRTPHATHYTAQARTQTLLFLIWKGRVIPIQGCFLIKLLFIHSFRHYNTHATHAHTHTRIQAHLSSVRRYKKVNMNKWTRRQHPHRERHTHIHTHTHTPTHIHTQHTHTVHTLWSRRKDFATDPGGAHSQLALSMSRSVPRLVGRIRGWEDWKSCFLLISWKLSENLFIPHNDHLGPMSDVYFLIQYEVKTFFHSSHYFQSSQPRISVSTLCYPPGKPK